MRLTDEKVNHLSHVLLKTLEKLPGVTFPRSANTARLRILALLREGVAEEEALGERVKKKIESAKKRPPEGSREWEILYRRYYEEEMARILPPAR